MKPTTNRRVLIVDDNHAIHDDFRKILCAGKNNSGAMDQAAAALFDEPQNATTSHDFKIDSAMQGREGLERVRQALQEGEPYAMAFIDVRMPPGWDGVETIARIWEVYPDLQVVMCTAYSDYSWDEMIAKIGQSDRLVILKKPFDNVEVLQLANALIAKWHLLQQTRSHVSELEARVRERTKEIETAHAKLQTEIDERNKMEIQLRHAQKMESIGQLAAGIAHEINTPTQYIGDNTRFVQDAFGDITRLVTEYDKLFSAAEKGAVTPELIGAVKSAAAAADMAYLSVEIPKAIQQSLDGVSRVTHIVRAMKEFSHPGTTEKTAVDLAKAIQSTVTVASNEWKYVADVVTEFDPALPPVSCLPGEFNQVVLNLIVNASHAIADVVGDGGNGKGTIIVSTRHDGDWAEVRIRDTGTGIPEHARAKVFDPFFTTKGVGKGTGQGLAIAHNVVVEKHGGTIAFETETGKGTTFIIRLPLKAASTERKAA
ncbi:MAG: hybrid sensor histidine kinase/response regulator [Verrucomicrobia bacterium]|nr:hybrid sensor histidine kinase/response regulator [Verrucomicrobiota bacterium]